MLDRELADVVWIYYGTQGFQARRIGLELTYFPLNEFTDCIPDYYTPVIVASEQTLDDRPELVRRFLSALTLAHEFVADSPEAAAQVLADAVPELDPEELALSVPWLAERMMSDGLWGHQELEIWADYGEWMAGTGVLEGEFDPASAFTSEFLPRR
jgi:ABC-type nitrate/sulfonate/bicarbonate transport system substrate-binding protein